MTASTECACEPGACPEMAAAAAACTCPSVAGCFNLRDRGDSPGCLACADLEIDQPCYSLREPVAGQGIARRPAMTMAEINRELDIPKANQGVTGNPNMAGHKSVPVYTCRHCGDHGNFPTHRHGCGRTATAALWHSRPAVAAREAAAERAAFMDEEPWADSQAWRDKYADLSGALAAAMADLLAEIDRQAGGA